MKKKIIAVFLLGILALSPTLSNVFNSANSATFKSGNALVSVPKTTIFDNGLKYYFPNHGGSTNYAQRKTYYGFKKGTQWLDFSTKAFLPLTSKGIKSQNIQGFTFDRSGKYVYATIGYTSKKYCKVVKYNYNKLVNYTKKYARAAKLKGKKKVKLQKKLKSALKKAAVKVTKKHNYGHGQSIEINPNDNKLYILSNNDYKNLKLYELSKKTLEPINTYAYSASSSKTIKHPAITHCDDPVYDETLSQFLDPVCEIVTPAYNTYETVYHKFTDVLTFDNQGNFYNVVKNSGGFKFYKGTIKNGKVQLKLAKNGILNNIGYNFQTMEWGNNQLYIESDGAIMSVPVNKLGFDSNSVPALDTDDIKYTILDTKREFEGLDFGVDGKMYIMLYKYPEIIRQN